MRIWMYVFFFSIDVIRFYRGFYLQILYRIGLLHKSGNQSVFKLIIHTFPDLYDFFTRFNFDMVKKNGFLIEIFEFVNKKNHY